MLPEHSYFVKPAFGIPRLFSPSHLDRRTEISIFPPQWSSPTAKDFNIAITTGYMNLEKKTAGGLWIKKKKKSMWMRVSIHRPFACVATAIPRRHTKSMRSDFYRRIHIKGAVITGERGVGEGGVAACCDNMGYGQYRSFVYHDINLRSLLFTCIIKDFTS